MIFVIVYTLENFFLKYGFRSFNMTKAAAAKTIPSSAASTSFTGNIFCGMIYPIHTPKKKHQQGKDIGNRRRLQRILRCKLDFNAVARLSMQTVFHGNSNVILSAEHSAGAALGASRGPFESHISDIFICFYNKS